MNPETENPTTEDQTTTIENPPNQIDDQAEFQVQEVDPQYIEENFITHTDVLHLFVAIIFFTSIAWIINRVITFIPDLMVDWVRKIKNKSMIYGNEHLNDPKLDPNLDKSDLGFKNLLDRWIK